MNATNLDNADCISQVTAHPRLALIAGGGSAQEAALAINLRAAEWDVTTTGCRDVATAATVGRAAQLVIIDLDYVGHDGIMMIGAIREVTNAPIVALSAHHESCQKVAVLDAGAVDYITKPFGIDELLARLRAQLRREDSDRRWVISAGALTIDLAAKRVYRNLMPVRLTPTEWNLLEILVRHRGLLVTQRQLLTQIWGPAHHKHTHYLRVYSAHLRQKLEEDPAHPVHIRTEPGMGYRFVG